MNQFLIPPWITYSRSFVNEDYVSYSGKISHKGRCYSYSRTELKKGRRFSVNSVSEANQAPLIISYPYRKD